MGVPVVGRKAGKDVYSSARTLVGTEGGPPKFPRLVDLLTFLDDIEWEQVILAHFTLSFAELFKSRVIYMNSCHLFPQLINVLDNRSKESEAVIKALKVAGILKKVTTYSSDESGDEKPNEAGPPQEPQPYLPEVKTENGHTEAHPNGKCDLNI
ncbi:hypothetical protein E2C01_038474 [Portunus trituberculatus]|uniref:Uncharacterized protein n=1 Tax=Portunus trituberculatus TaxID=210409 RepID=A0A5B7FK84_PORTR|nr:hypothetical protein [Portunus trituberculatus]